MLELRHVCKRFKRSPAVDDVSFSARVGEITGYLGPNGSGKSTTMKMITGLIETTSGKILFKGESIERDLIAYKQRIGYVPEEPHLYSHLSGLEYLTMVGKLRALPAKPTIDGIELNCFGFSRCMVIGMPRLGRIQRGCARRCFFRRRCCTTPIFSYWTNLFPAST